PGSASGRGPSGHRGQDLPFPRCAGELQWGHTAHPPFWRSAMRRHALFALGVGLGFVGFESLLAAGDPKDEAMKKDRKKYEGTWQVLSLEVDGNQAAEENAQKITVINEADGKWAIEVEGKVVARGTSEIDPTKKPKAVDLTVTEGENSGKTALGI